MPSHMINPWTTFTGGRQELACSLKAGSDLLSCTCICLLQASARAKAYLYCGEESAGIKAKKNLKHVANSLQREHWLQGAGARCGD